MVITARIGISTSLRRESPCFTCSVKPSTLDTLMPEMTGAEAYILGCYSFFSSSTYSTTSWNVKVVKTSRVMAVWSWSNRLTLTTGRGGETRMLSTAAAHCTVASEFKASQVRVGRKAVGSGGEAWSLSDFDDSLNSGGSPHTASTHSPQVASSRLDD